MAAHVHLKDEFTEDKQYHNLMIWLRLSPNNHFIRFSGISCYTNFCVFLVSASAGEIWFLRSRVPVRILEHRSRSRGGMLFMSVKFGYRHSHSTLKPKILWPRKVVVVILKNWTVWFYHAIDAVGMANSVNSDQEQSDLGLHSLPRPICPKT